MTSTDVLVPHGNKSTLMVELGLEVLEGIRALQMAFAALLLDY